MLFGRPLSQKGLGLGLGLEKSLDYITGSHYSRPIPVGSSDQCIRIAAAAIPVIASGDEGYALVLSQ